MPRFSKLSDWLAWLETLHPSAIDLGLNRVYQVAQTLKLFQSPSLTPCLQEQSGVLNIAQVQVFMVAGTNGKGSCVATIEQALVDQRYAVGSYTSPHLHEYSERIRINGIPVEDALICDAFSAIDQARGDISLTYFEFGTLAALWIFVQQKLPYVVLEVGLGGRLDAVNIVDADIAIITSIDVDHEEWLGDDRNIIAQEKLGITRANKPVIITEENLTPSLVEFAQQHTPSYVLHQDFHISNLTAALWVWTSSMQDQPITLPMPALPLTSVAAGLQALAIKGLLPEHAQLQTLLSQIQLAGRFQQVSIAGKSVVYDVAHNPAAARALAKKLLQNSKQGQTTHAVFALMADKDIQAIIGELHDVIDSWHYAALSDNPRSASVDMMSHALQKQEKTVPYLHITDAFESALSQSAERDRIVVFGSFFTVQAVQQYCAARVENSKSRG